MTKSIIITTFAFVTASIMTWAGTETASVKYAKAQSIFSLSTLKKNDAILGVDSRYNRVAVLHSDVASALFFSPEKTLVISGFPVGTDQTGTLQLRRTNPVANEQTRWLFKDQYRPGPKAVTYSGFIQNEIGSQVRLCYVNNRMYGIIAHADGSTTMIAPEGSYDVASGQHIIASDNDPRYAEMWKNFRCGADEVAVITPDGKEKPFAMPLSTDLLEVEVGVEVDVPVFNKFLRDAKNDVDVAYEMTEAYIYAIFAMSSSIYENETNVMLTVSFVKIWTSVTDIGYPKYNSYGADGSAMLFKEADIWSKLNNKSGTYKRDLLHMVTSYQGSGLYTAGIAYSGANYSGTVCLQDQGYGLSSLQYGSQMPVIAFAWDVEVISHEMGHNFRSPHTHNCTGNVWPNNIPLDTCVNKSSIEDACYGPNISPRIPWNKGTIMSYCHLLNAQNGTVLEFRPIVAAVIRDGAERAVARGCVNGPDNPIIKMQYPLGRNNISGGKTDTIRWTSAKVNTVRVEFSDNNGQSWTQIGQDVAAGVRKMPWLIPPKSSNQYLVRVIDPTNPVVGDSSWVAFSVQAATIALQYPAGGERIGQSQKPTITWTASLINTFKIEFSSDGGAGWTTIAASATGNTYSWTVPSIATDKAVIRVSSANDGSIVSQSGYFSIGKEMLEILSKDNLDTLCRGKVWRIWWKSDFIQPNVNMMIEISDNGGTSWARVTNALGVKLSDGYYDGWTVPTSLKTTPNGLLRIYQRQNEIIADTMTVAIQDCNFTSVADTWGESVSPMLEAMPNPASNEIALHITLPENCSNAQFYLVDAAGHKAMLGSFDNLPAGSHSLNFDVNTVAQGAYYLTMQSGIRSVSIPVRIVR